MEKVYSKEFLLNFEKIEAKYYITGEKYPYLITYKNSCLWEKNNNLDRVDGPARIYTNMSYKEWFIDNKLHRVDGPAVMNRHGYKSWYVDDRLHRVDGPAAIYPCGEQEWYVYGKHTTKEKIDLLRRKYFNKWIYKLKMNIIFI